MKEGQAVLNIKLGDSAVRGYVSGSWLANVRHTAMPEILPATIYP